MNTTPQLLLLSGSQRQASFNVRLLNHIAQHLETSCSFLTAEPFAEHLPLFNQDLENRPEVRAQVAELHAVFMACDGIVVASPEYNGQLTPYLKNIIDWVSRLAYIDPSFQNPFVDKPVLLCAASTGSSGGATGIPSARALFGYVGGLVFGETLCVPLAHEAWTEAGYFFNDDFESRIYSVSQRFALQALRFHAETQG
jgi:chromate reductase, NAD(P)H dehydrogenase (quinone)